MKRLVRKWWKVLPCLLICLPVVACGESEPVIGTVVEKVYDDPDFYLMPVTTCGKTCIVTTVPTNEPAEFLLLVEQADGETRTVSIDPMTWEDTNLGDDYDETIR